VLAVDDTVDIAEEVSEVVAVLDNEEVAVELTVVTEQSRKVPDTYPVSALFNCNTSCMHTASLDSTRSPYKLHVILPVTPGNASFCESSRINKFSASATTEHFALGSTDSDAFPSNTSWLLQLRVPLAGKS
jgi:hypothetical protein